MNRKIKNAYVYVYKLDLYNKMYVFVSNQFKICTN